MCEVNISRCTCCVGEISLSLLLQSRLILGKSTWRNQLMEKKKKKRNRFKKKKSMIIDQNIKH